MCVEKRKKQRQRVVWRAGERLYCDFQDGWIVGSFVSADFPPPTWTKSDIYIYGTNLGGSIIHVFAGFELEQVEYVTYTSD